MTLDEKIMCFIKKMGYMDNEHVLGILFYGSYLSGFNTKNSDIDLHIIFDNSNPEYSIRGNTYIDNTRIEYFEKTIDNIYDGIEEDYNSQNNAPLTIFGTSRIIYAKDDTLRKLQEYVIDKFSKPMPSLSIDEACEQVSIINNRMNKLERYAITDDPYFEHLYHLTIDKIRRFYHSLLGIPRIETSKGFKLYTDSEYRYAFRIEEIPEQIFIDMYFDAISNSDLNKLEKYQLITKIYHFTKRNVNLNEDEHRILIKSRNTLFDVPIVKPSVINDIKNIDIPQETLKKILLFIKQMNYLDAEHCLGMFVYGSSLTGFNTLVSDIDLHIIFDDNDPTRLIRGSKIIDGTKIEYFEKPINDIYLSTINGYLNQDNACYALFGMGSIVFDRDNKMKELQQYVIDTYSKVMPPLSIDEAREQVSIINNRMEKLEKSAINDSPYFDHLYHLVIEKIRKFYHKYKGVPKIQTSKVYRIYTDSDYRNSMYKENPDEEFVKMYLDLITTDCMDKFKKLEMVLELYNYTTKDINLGDDYRIVIKNKNVKKDINLEDTSNVKRLYKK